MDIEDAPSPIAHYKAILAYDGTNFAGFQKQAKVRTVQAEIEIALRKLGWTQRSILAAGRTDTGVHASGQVISFELRWVRSIDALISALNAHLPVDIAVQQITIVPKGFHPRFDAQARLYRYTLFCDAVRHPIRERYAWRVWPKIDFNLLEQTAVTLVGTHDFQAFGTPPQAGGSTVRNVFVAKWKQMEVQSSAILDASPDFVFEIEANAFLFHMVRRIVRLQVSIAQKRLPVESISLYLTEKYPNSVKGLAPPHGLNLSSVCYPDPKL